MCGRGGEGITLGSHTPFVQSARGPILGTAPPPLVQDMPHTRLMKICLALWFIVQMNDEALATRQLVQLPPTETVATYHKFARKIRFPCGMGSRRRSRRSQDFGKEPEPQITIDKEDAVNDKKTQETGNVLTKLVNMFQKSLTKTNKVNYNSTKSNLTKSFQTELENLRALKSSRGRRSIRDGSNNQREVIKRNILIAVRHLDADLLEAAAMSVS